MGKRMRFFIVLIMVMMLAGCAGKEAETSEREATDSGSVALPVSTEYSFLTEEEEAGEEGTVWKDNAVDDYTAVINLRVAAETVKGTISGGVGGVFLSELGCIFHKQHLFPLSKDNWYGVNGYLPEGEEFKASFNLKADDEYGYFNIGNLSGEKGYAAFKIVWGEGNAVTETWFYELDESFQIVRKVKTEELMQKEISEFMGDAEGNFHLTHLTSPSKTEYFIYSPEGKRIFDEVLDFPMTLCAYGGGRVAACTDITCAECRMYEADLKAGNLRELPVSSEKNFKRGMGLTDYVFAMVPLDENGCIWCTKEGVFTCYSQEKEKKLLYKWSNHGIIPQRIENVLVTADGTIEILYHDADGRNFVALRPTERKEELKSITIAVSPYNKNAYLSAAAYFINKYPQYNVIVKDDYDKTSLLTQLGAGDGPVLIDTELTGFEDLEKLWQPLDGFLEASGLAKEFIPEALELGKIGGVTYGIVNCFRISTLLVAEEGPKDWDYEGFVEALEKYDGAAFTYQFIQSAVDWRERFFTFFQNGLEDNYFLKPETGEMIFGTPSFERLLKVSEKAKKCPPYDEGKAIKKGKALFELFNVITLNQIFQLRRRLEAEGERAIGYPTKNGAKHFMEAVYPLAMRSTATDEEKEIAYTFMKVFLSKDAMMEDSRYLPVRKDVLEERLKQYEESNNMAKEYGYYDPIMSPELDWDKDIKFFEDLIHNSIPKKVFPASLQAVFDEEFSDYLGGRIDGKALDSHLKSRVWLYLEEQK